MAPEPTSKVEDAEQEITQQIGAAGVRLRFDKVALRLVEGLKAEIGESLPEDQSLVFLVTAPIRHPAKTRVALREWLRGLPAGGARETIHGNEVRARRVSAVFSGMPKVLGFVHNPAGDPDAILDLAEANLRGR